MGYSSERREPSDPWSDRQPRFEGLAGEGPNRFFLLAGLPSGEPMRVQLHQVRLRSYAAFVVIDPG